MSALRKNGATVRSFADRSFFMLFEAIVRRDNPQLALDTWTAHGVEWERARHSFAERRYGYTYDVFVAVRPGRTGWSLIVVKEHWWAGRHGDVVKSQYWAKPLKGARPAIVAWLAEQKRLLEL